MGTTHWNISARKSKSVRSAYSPINEVDDVDLSASLQAVDVAALRHKYESLRETLRAMDSVVVGFSGGSHSALVTKIAHDVLGLSAVAATVVMPAQRPRERDEAMALGYAIGVPLVTIEVASGAEDPKQNLPSTIFNQLSHVAEKRGIHWIVYGANRAESTDLDRAADVPQLWPRMPLAEVGLTDPEIDILSRELGLSAVETAGDRGSTKVDRYAAGTPDVTGRLYAAEEFLHDLGFRRLTLHDHDSLARLEADPAEMSQLLNPDIRSQITKKLKSLGYTFVAVDLEGSRRD
jgi:uncharacterized protein